MSLMYILYQDMGISTLICLKSNKENANKSKNVGFYTWNPHLQHGIISGTLVHFQWQHFVRERVRLWLAAVILVFTIPDGFVANQLEAFTSLIRDSLIDGQALLHSRGQQWDVVARDQEGREIEQIQEHFVSVTEKPQV